MKTTFYPVGFQPTSHEFFNITSEFSSVERFSAKTIDGTFKLKSVILAEKEIGPEDVESIIYLVDVKGCVITSNSSILIRSFEELYNSFGDDMFNNLELKVMKKVSKGGRTFNYLTLA